MNGKQVIAKLKTAGWSLSHITGSHPIRQKDGAPRDVPVPVHGTKDLGNGLVASRQCQTGVDLVTILMSAQLCRRYPWIIQPFANFFLKLHSNTAVKFAPFLQGILKKS